MKIDRTLTFTFKTEDGVEIPLTGELTMFPDPFDRIPDEVEISDEESYGTAHEVTIELDEWAQAHSEVIAWVRKNKSRAAWYVIAANLVHMSTEELQGIAKFLDLL